MTTTLTILLAVAAAQPQAEPRQGAALLTVRDFGASGDGQADDTAAIQRAADRGGEIRFPRGTYRISRPVVIDLDRAGHTSIVADGTASLRMAGPGPALKLVGTHAGTASPDSVKENVWQRQRTPMIDGLEIVGEHPEAIGLWLEGTFQPVITPEDSEFSTGQTAIPIGGPTAAQWSVATRAERDGVLATAVDVLRWYTAPQNGGRMIGELGSFLPNLKGSEVNPDLKEPLKAISEGLGEAAMFVYPDKIDTENREKMTPIWTDWKLDQITLEDAQQQLDTIMTEYAKAAIAKNGWTC